MTNTTLLIIAIMLVVILIQMVINIGLADSNMKLNAMMDELDNELNIQSELIDSLREELEMKCYIIDDTKRHRDYLIDKLCDFRNAVNRLPKHLQTRVKMEWQDD